MIASNPTTQFQIKHPITLTDKAFIENKNAHYKWLRAEAPVYKGKMMMMSFYLLSRYEDCVAILKDPRFVRNRNTATGKGRMPFPVPKSITLMMQSMIVEDEPNHRRLRTLVHKAFTPRHLAKLEGRIEELTHELLDTAEKQGGAIDLMQAYSLPIPVTVIGEMVGVSNKEIPHFGNYMDSLATGFSGWKMFRTLFWDLPDAVKFVRSLIERKRANPQDDILTALIEAEEDGETLTEDELIAMVFLLIVAGYETTVHLITNAVETLLMHPSVLGELMADNSLMGSAVEEVLRYNGPIHGTKPNYAIEDVTLHGVTIPKGGAVMPLLGSANRDPAVFDNPEQFNIRRTPNRHLGFGQGIHYCLGAPLARLETKIALTNLFDRYPNLRLAVPPEELELQYIPGWHRRVSLPVLLK